MEDRKKLNKELCEKYPILIIHNRLTGKIPDNYDYTELDGFPEGWLKAFGMNMIKDMQEHINTLLKETQQALYIVDIKEKYGYLRVYLSGYTEELRKIIRKYEEVSKRTCIKCGKRATKISTGWICPWCDECIKSMSDNGVIDINEFYEEDEDD